LHGSLRSGCADSRRSAPGKPGVLRQGLLQCNAHVDVVDWRRNRAFIGDEAAVDRLVAHLRARRDGGADPDEPTGLLTHHLDMTEGAWRFVAALVERTRERGAAWLDVRDAFRISRMGRRYFRPISMKRT
jgi:hypothetical protein